MTIQIFPPTAAGQASALAVSDPKNVEFSGGHWVVRTGIDYTIPIGPSQYDIDEAAAIGYSKLQAFIAMTPVQIQAKIAADFGGLTQTQQDDLSVLATAVNILARRI